MSQHTRANRQVHPFRNAVLKHLQKLSFAPRGTTHHGAGHVGKKTGMLSHTQVERLATTYGRTHVTRYVGFGAQA